METKFTAWMACTICASQCLTQYVDSIPLWGLPSWSWIVVAGWWCAAGVAQALKA